jgi:hypothetical protein
MKTFISFIREKDSLFAEALDLKDIKTKVYSAIRAKMSDDEGTSSPDDVWNQELEIFDDKDDILDDPELTDMINNHPDRGAILRDIETGKVTVGTLVKKLASAAKEKRPEPEPSMPSLPGGSQGVMEPGNNPVPIA